MTNRRPDRLAPWAIGIAAVSAGLAAAPIAPTGWRSFSAFATLSGAVAVAGWAYNQKDRVRSLSGGVCAGLLALGAIASIWLPSSSESSYTADDQGYLQEGGPASTTASSPEAESSASPARNSTRPTPSSTPSPLLTPSVGPVASEVTSVEVSDGTTAVVFDELRIGLQHSYSSYAAMGLYTYDVACDSMFPDVGESMTLVTPDSVAYDVALMASSLSDGAKFEIRKRGARQEELEGCGT